ncbi:PilW family protein [Silvimonas soli]|uniref:PilW family protein n=1 Tax=Silvimonas soli TaxID=2980100 RepID=UPI0024B327E3|nr:PilW family protein [Silvimonas soli]
MSLKQNNRPLVLRKNDEHGFSVMELMIALVIGLIVSLIIFSVLKANEGRKRTIVSVGDMDQAGSYALFQADQLIRSAGTGFSGDPATTYGCALSAINQAGISILPPVAALPAPFDNLTADISTYRLAPVLIDKGGSSFVNPLNNAAPASDILVVMAGNGGVAEYQTYLTATAPTSGSVSVPNSANFSANDIILAAAPTALTTGNNGNCYVDQLSSAAITSYIGPVTLSLGGSLHSSTTGIGNVPGTTGELMSIGNLNSATPGSTTNAPRFVAITAGAYNTLYSYDLLHMTSLMRGQASETVQPLADGIVEIHAVYGIWTPTGLEWVDPSGNYSSSNLMSGTPAANGLLQSIRAVRVAMLIRTSLPEKTAIQESANAGTRTVAMFTDLASAAGTPAPSYSRALSGQELNYRYRVVESTIPIRNVAK